MTNGGFEYTIEIKDRFAKILEEFRATLAQARAEAGGLSKQLTALARASENAKTSLSGQATEIKAVAKAEEDLSKAIGNATSAQRRKMTQDQREDDTLAKRVSRQKEAANVEAKAAAQGIDFSKKRVAAAKQELSVEEKINAVIAKRAAFRELRSGLRAQGFDPKGDKTYDRVSEVIDAAQERRETAAGLRSLGVDSQGNDAAQRANEVLARRKELLEQIAELKRRGFDAKGNALLSEEAQSTQRVAATIERSNRARMDANALRAQGLDARGNAILSEQAASEARVAAAIERGNRARMDADALRAQGLDARGNAILSEEALSAQRVAAVLERINRARMDAAALRAQGLDARGNALLSEQAASEARVAAAIERGNRARMDANALRARGRDARGNIPTTPQEAAQVKAANELRRLEIKRFYRQAVEATPAIAALRRELGETTTAGNRISFTFRRLFGILALFTILRKVVEGLKNTVRASVDFNATIETSTLGIASLIAATGKLQNATGNVVSTTEGWALAQTEARRQLALLRKDALTTAATFPELAAAFQSAIGPGVGAGLNLDEIRRFSSDISKAASAIGLEQSQLAEEIRSVLQGTISKRNTRIATSLGITNQDIARAKELGTLFEFLERKFGAFNRASEDGAKTFTVLLSNAKDALNNLLGVSFTGFFESLKSLLTLINTSIVRLSAGGVVINPQLVAAFEQIGQVLELAVDQAKIIINTLSAGGAEDTFAAIGAALKLVIVLASDLIQGLLLGSRVVALFLRPFVEIGTAITELLGPAVNTILIWAVAFGAAINIARLSTVGLYAQLVRSAVMLRTMVGYTAAMQFNLGTIRNYMIAIGFAARGILGVLALVSVLGIEFDLIGDKMESLTGKTASWKTVLKSIGFEFIGLVKLIGQNIADVAGTLLNNLIIGFSSFFALVAQAYSKLLDAVPAGLPGIGAAAKLAKVKVDALRDSLVDAASAASEDNARDGGLFQRGIERLRTLKKDTLDYYSTLSDEENGVKTSFSELIGKIPAIVSAPSRDLDEMAKGAEKLKDEITAANEELRTTLATLRLEGTVLQQIKLVTEARIRIEKEGKVFDADRAQAQSDLLKAGKDRLEVEREIAKASDSERAKIYQSVQAIKDVTKANSELFAAKEQKGAVDEAFGKGKLSLLEVQKADAAVKEKEAAAAAAKARADNIGAQETSYALALRLNDAETRQSLASQALNGILGKRRQLMEQIYSLMSSKIAALGAAEVEASKQRREELQAQFEAAKRVLNASGDEGVAAANNEVEAAKRNLAEVVKKNKVQEQGLSLLLKEARTFADYIGLQGQLTALKTEGAAAEELAAVEVEQAEQNKLQTILQIAAARRESVTASRNEIAEIEAQVEAETALLEAKQQGTGISERIADSNIQIKAIEVRAKAEAAIASDKKAQLLSQLAITRDGNAQLVILRQLADLEKTVLQRIILQALQTARLRNEQAQLRQAEQDRIRESEAATRGSRASFNAAQGVDRQAAALVDKFVQLEKEQNTLATILNTQTSTTDEIQAQREAVRQVSVEYQKLLNQANSPVSEGLFDGAQQFIRDVPTAFETAAETTKALFSGLSNVAADALTAAFDPRNTTTLRERLGELFLGIGNLLFKSIIENLVSTTLTSLLPKLAAETASNAAGDAIGDFASDTAGGVAGGATAGAGVVAAGAVVAAEVTAAGAVLTGAISSLGLQLYVSNLQMQGAQAAILLEMGIFPLKLGIVTNEIIIAGNALAAAISAAAAKIAVSSAIPGGYYGGIVTAHDGGAIRPRYFAAGGRSGGRIGGLGGSSTKRAADKIPALLRAGEFVMTPEAVQMYGGEEFFNALNSMSLSPSAVQDLGRPGASPKLNGGGRGGRGGGDRGSVQRVQVAPSPAYIVPSEQALEQLLAQGDGAMQRYLGERGYQPSWRS